MLRVPCCSPGYPSRDRVVRLDGLRRLEGQRYFKTRTAAFATTNRDTAPMLLEDLARTGEPDTGTGNATRDIATPVEAVENARQVLFGNAKPLVFYPHERSCRVGWVHLNRYLYSSTGWTVDDCIRY